MFKLNKNSYLIENEEDLVLYLISILNWDEAKNEQTNLLVIEKTYEEMPLIYSLEEITCYESYCGFIIDYVISNNGFEYHLNYDFHDNKFKIIRKKIK